MQCTKHQYQRGKLLHYMDTTWNGIPVHVHNILYGYEELCLRKNSVFSWNGCFIKNSKRVVYFNWYYMSIIIFRKLEYGSACTYTKMISMEYYIKQKRSYKTACAVNTLRTKVLKEKLWNFDNNLGNLSNAFDKVNKKFFL